MSLAERRFPFVPLVALIGWQLRSAASLLLPEIDFVTLCLPMLQMRARGTSFVEALLVRRSEKDEATVDTSGSQSTETKFLGCDGEILIIDLCRLKCRGELSWWLG
jgi:hypothetical protein